MCAPTHASHQPIFNFSAVAHLRLVQISCRHLYSFGISRGFMPARPHEAVSNPSLSDKVRRRFTDLQAQSTHEFRNWARRSRTAVNDGRLVQLHDFKVVIS